MSPFTLHWEKHFPYLARDNSIFRNNSRITDLPRMSYPPHAGVFPGTQVTITLCQTFHNPLPDFSFTPLNPPSLGCCHTSHSDQNVFQKACISISSKNVSSQFLCLAIPRLAMALLVVQKSEHHMHLLRKGMRLFLISCCP